MTLDINAFKQRIRHPARPTHFLVQLNFPGNDNTESDQFYCKGAQIPSSNIGMVELSYMGRKAKYAGDRTYDDWSITIYNDDDFTIRKKFERWLELINTTKTNISEIDWAKIQTDMIVFHLNGQNKIIKQYIFKNAWPTMPGDAIDLAWDNNDTAEEYTVNISYDYWESPDTTR